jgi:hypothetical protein
MKNIWKILLAVSIPVAVIAVKKKKEENPKIVPSEHNLFI